MLEVIKTVANGVKSALSDARWSKISLVLLGPAQECLHVFRITREPNMAYWNNVRAGALIAGSELGVKVDFRLGGAEGEQSQQALLQEAIEHGVQGIAIAPIDPVAMEALIRRAEEAGIPVVTVDAPPVAGSRALAYIGTDNEAAGKLAGETMARLVPAGASVALQVCHFSAQNGRERAEGFRRGVAAAALTTYAPTENKFNIAIGERLAATDLAEHPELAGAFGACAQSGPSWAAAARSMGRGGDLKIVSFDLTTDSIAMLREGLIHVVVAQREFDMGFRGVELLHRMATNGVEAALSELPPSRCVDTGVDLVTLERTSWSVSLEEYMRQEIRRRFMRRGTSVQAITAPSVRLSFIGMTMDHDAVTHETTPFEPRSLVGQVMRAAQSLIVDPAAPDHKDLTDVSAARKDHLRTLIGVPLVARDTVFGALLVGCEEEDACTLESLEMLECIAGIAAVALDSMQLFKDVTERTQELERANQRQETLLQTIADLSSPIVPIAPGVLVMPLTGTMDARRAERFLEAMLREISQSKARVVLLDVTGLVMDEADVVEHLLKAARAASLLGAEVVLVGMSPVAARVMAQQGLDLGAVKTRSNLELGFAYALSLLGGHITYGQARPALRR